MADHKLSKSTTEESFVPDVSEVVSKVPKKKKNETPEERKLRKEAERSLRHPSEREVKKEEKVSDKTSDKTSDKKSKQKKEASTSVAPAPLPEEKKVSKKSKKLVEKKEEESKTEVVVEEKTKSRKKVKSEVVEETETSSTPLSFGIDVPSSRRHTLEREELENYFDHYIKVLESELDQSRENKNRKVNVRTWRLLLNEIRRLKTVSLRVMKKPKRRSENAQSGFMKPVHISQEMAEFAGWSTSDLKSRVDVTKYICNYIKEHNLQNPEDRRQIVADERLSKLLKHDASSDTPLTYYLLQKKIQPHFLLDA
jgi:upstream activation factor subunit UAF30